MRTLLNLTFMALALTMFSIGCGKTDQNNGGGGSNIPPAWSNGCQSGYINTQYGCLPQGSCPANYAQYNGQCVPATSNQCQSGYVKTQYGCLPQGSCPANYGQYNGQCVPASGGSNSSCPSGYIGTYPNCYPSGGGTGGSTGGTGQLCPPGYYPYPTPYSPYGYICYWFGGYGY